MSVIHFKDCVHFYFTENILSKYNVGLNYGECKMVIHNKSRNKLIH